jgi:hypothetical protein
MVAERQRQVRQFARKRRRRRPLPVRLSRGLLHKRLPLRLNRPRQYLQNRATLSSKFC